MGKRILVVFFSQTGQLRRCAEAMLAPLQADPQIDLDWCELRPMRPYPFPWPFFEFFDQFPEAVHLAPPALEPLRIPAQRYDLIVLAYTVWFLSPAPPITAFLKSDHGRALMHDTPVITLIACRNMWHMAQEQVKAMLTDAGARLSDNVVLTDSGSSFATFITTPRWMLTGRNTPLWGLPAAGIREADIRATRRFGDAIVTALHENRVDGRTPVLEGLGAVEADVRLIPSEKIGRRSFYLWGKLIRACGASGAAARKPILVLYAVFLVLMIVTVVPITMVLRALLRPLMRRRQMAQKTYFELPSGSSRLRLDEASSNG